MTSHLRYLAGVLFLAAVYFGTAKLGFTLDSADSAANQVTIVWPPTGISLACLLVFGYRLWPGVAVGAFLANATSNEPLWVACGIAVGNTLEAVLGAWLLRRVIGFRNPLERLADVLGLIVLAAGVSTTVSATIGAAFLCLGDVQPREPFGTLWWTWWLGDAMGDVVMAPAVLTWATWARRPWHTHRLAESVAFVVVVATVSIAVFSGANPSAGYPLEYTIFPFLIWGALRLGQRGVATGTLVALVIAVVSTVNQTGPFAGNTPHQSLLQLHFFMAVLAVTSLLLGAATCERRMEERRRAVGYTITAVLAEAPTLAEAAPRLLELIGEKLDWDLGALWTLDPQAQLLRCVEVWQAPGLRTADFENVTRTATFPPGIGLPGRVWASGRPLWIADVSVDMNFPRAAAAARARLRSGFGFPIVLATDTLGVLEFFSTQCQPRDKELLKRLADYGGQIGQFIERRRAEEALRQSREALRETDRRKDEFLAMLAHELRNPLAPILNSLHILNLSAADAAAQGQAREVIERQVQHLVRLVDDLLDVSRIMRGKIELRRDRLDLSVAIARAVETAQPIIDSRRHRLTVALPAEPIVVHADLVRLSQVIANLLNNAAKYTDPGGDIRLSTEQQGDEAVVRVRDTGVGIAADVLPRIFDLFVQADRSLDRSHGGMGIGLTLVRTLVERHGGTVAATSEGVGRGSEFVVRLPLPGCSPAQPSQSDDAVEVLAAPKAPSGQLPVRRVLVVDDNKDAADSLAILLGLYGQKVHVVHNGMAALEAALSEPPDVVFLDLGMPGMNGFEVAQRLRQQPGSENVLLVAVTGWGQAEDRRRTHEAGFDHHLVKPVEAAAVQTLLARGNAPVQ